MAPFLLLTQAEKRARTVKGRSLHTRRKALWYLKPPRQADEPTRNPRSAEVQRTFWEEPLSSLRISIGILLFSRTFPLLPHIIIKKRATRTADRPTLASNTKDDIISKKAEVCLGRRLAMPASPVRPLCPRCRFRGASQVLKQGFFSPSDAIAASNPIHTRKRIRLKRELQSDGSCRVNRMRCRLSICCASTFQSIETFFGFLTCFFGPKGKVDANVFRSPGNLPEQRRACAVVEHLTEKAM